MFDLKFEQNNRHILHIDADAFFASVEQSINPKLRGKPVLIGGSSKNKGVVCTASYEAKRMGVKTGMPMYKALKICPNAVTVASNHSLYAEYSRKMFKIFKGFSNEVEMVSIDEAFIDVTDYLLLYKKDAYLIARDILYEVHKKLGITVSCGVSSNKTVSKIASSLNKPHKLTVIPFGKEREYLSSLSLAVMSGIGSKTFSIFKKHGLNTLGDLANMDFYEVVNKFGISFVSLWKRAQGFDNSPVDASFHDPKSISHEQTFYVEGNKENCLKILKELSRKVFLRLRQNDMQARKIFIKIRYKSSNETKNLFEDYSFQKQIDIGSDTDKDLYPMIRDLFMNHVNFNLPIRLVGVGVGDLVKNYNLNLFESQNKNLRLFKAIDLLNRDAGFSAVKYGV